MLRFFAVLTWCVLLVPAYAQQPSFTANTTVPPFHGEFGYGTNMGYYPPYYYDKELATLVKGTADGSVPGVGVTTIRPGLYEFFLDYWGFDVRKEHFQYYKDLGIKDVVVMIGFPSDQHRDPSFYCPNSQSDVFKGMYEPIWDNGENGTPVNDNNVYALYCWKMANTYKDYVTYWEVWNEPDIDLSGNAWAPPGYPGNWWDNAPGPCETKMKAPMYYYIRLLRISYEVIKSVAPEDYVAVGGLGNPSYLDAVLRYTDNPFDGTENAQYPLKGGAYFDCMSFHSYPHIDNSMRWWDNNIQGFAYARHSDEANDGLWRLKHRFEDVLTDRGYNGAQYPKKRWLCTEFNIPRKAYQDYIGSDLAQCNFMIKALTTAQAENMDQMHIYCLADEKPEAEANNEFSYMGLFKNLNNKPLYQSEANQVAYAFKTTSKLLGGKKFDAARTNQLQLPANVGGYAFRDPVTNQYTYVLWAKTTHDMDETADATYSFPPNMLASKNLDQKFWHYSQSGTHLIVNAGQVKLNGSPVFLTETFVNNSFPKQPTASPNPAVARHSVYSFYMFEEARASVDMFDSRGALVRNLAQDEPFAEGANQLELDFTSLTPGIYYIRLTTPESSVTTNVVVY